MRVSPACEEVSMKRSEMFGSGSAGNVAAYLLGAGLYLCLFALGLKLI